MHKKMFNLIKRKQFKITANNCNIYYMLGTVQRS